MKKTRIALRIAGAILILAISASCASREQNFMRIAQEKGMTRDQASVAFVKALRYWWLRAKSGGGYDVNYSAIKTEKVIEMIASMEEDAGKVFDDPKQAQFAKLMGLDNTVRERRKVYKVLLDNLRANYLAVVLSELLGENRYNGNSSIEGKSFSLKMALPPEKMSAFTSDAVERAKETGRLRAIQSLKVMFDDKLAEKAKDPADPLEKNKWIWKSKREGLEIITYKIFDEGEKPGDNNGDYIEAWRISFENGHDGTPPVLRRESKPCIKVFASASSTSLNIYVIDIDRENAEHGFGMPDVVRSLETITSGRDLYLNHADIIATIFAERKEPARTEPPPMKIEIVRTGETPPLSWEEATAPEGYKVPFTYATHDRDNYTIEIEFEMPAHGSGNHGAIQSGTKKIKHILKKYHAPGDASTASPGEVIEYFKPKFPYDGNDVLAAETTGGKELEITIEGTAKVIGLIVDKKNLFIEDIPYQIDYTVGKKRWRIADLKNNDGKYESRRSISGSRQSAPTGTDPSAGEGFVGLEFTP